MAVNSAVANSEVCKLLDQMVLTVIDDDFPREVLASTSLTFGKYRMPARRNWSEGYNASNKSIGVGKRVQRVWSNFGANWPATPKSELA